MSGVMPSTEAPENKTPDIDSLLPFIIATIEPANEITASTFGEVGQYQEQEQETLHPSLRENIRAELKDYPEKAYPLEEDISDYEPDMFTCTRTYQGRYEVAFRRQQDGKINCNWTLGRGASRFGPTRGVTHLIGRPGKDPRGVAARHVKIEIDQDSGQLYLVGLDDNHPVTVFVNAQAQILRKGDRHVLEHMRTRFEIGQLQFIFVFRDMKPMEDCYYVLVRNIALDSNGLRQPDGRLQPLPAKVRRQQAGSLVFHPLLGVGSFGTVWAAVDKSTARPWAVKEMHVHRAEILHGLLNELTIYLSYQGRRGLIQAKEISDDRGNTWHPGEAVKMQGFLRTSPFAYKIYVVIPLAVDLWRWSQDKPSFALIVMVFQGVVEGLRILHVDVYLHRDVTTLNMFVLPGLPLNGALGDFGKAVLKATSSSEEIGPAATRAPEVDGRTQYGKPADVYSLGFAMTTILLPEVEVWPSYSCDHRQSKEWLEATYEALEKCAASSEPAAHYSRLLRGMLAFNPDDRPCMEEVAYEWAQFEGPTLQRSCALPPKSYGQSLDKAKTPEATSLSLTPLINPRSLDSGKRMPRIPSNLPQKRTNGSVSEPATKLPNLLTESKAQFVSTSKASTSATPLPTTPNPPIARSKPNPFDDLYTTGPQAGGHDQPLQKPHTLPPITIPTIHSTPSVPQKRTVSSVSNAAAKPGNPKLAKATMESETQSVSTDTDINTTSQKSATEAEATVEVEVVH